MDLAGIRAQHSVSGPLMNDSAEANNSRQACHFWLPVASIASGFHSQFAEVPRLARSTDAGRP